MELRYKLVEKYLRNSYMYNAEELYNSLIKYRLDCIKNNINDDEDISKYFCKFEMKKIVQLLSAENQTESFIRWINKIFPNYHIEYDKNQKNKFFNIKILLFLVLTYCLYNIILLLFT